VRPGGYRLWSDLSGGFLAEELPDETAAEPLTLLG